MAATAAAGVLRSIGALVDSATAPFILWSLPYARANLTDQYATSLPNTTTGHEFLLPKLRGEALPPPGATRNVAALPASQLPSSLPWPRSVFTNNSEAVIVAAKRGENCNAAW